MIKENFKKAIVYIWLAFFAWLLPTTIAGFSGHFGFAVIWGVFSLVPIIVTLVFVLMNIIPELFEDK